MRPPSPDATANDQATEPSVNAGTAAGIAVAAAVVGAAIVGSIYRSKTATKQLNGHVELLGPSHRHDNAEKTCTPAERGGVQPYEVASV